MQVNSSTATQPNSTTSTSQTQATPTVDYNSFLQLLIAEMQHQDPTNPTDPTQFISQLASFSSVEQSVDTNSKLDTMLTTSALSQAEQAIGRTATSADGSVTGQVVAVNIGTGGTVTALLADGTQLPLGAGVTIS
jgi:flagellar basal-body rod modification protein FlgD